MNCFDIKDNLRRVMRDENCYDKELHEYLLKRNCYYLLSQIGYDSMQLISIVASNSIINNQRYLICREVFSSLEKDIPYANIKGSVLSSRIYGHPAYRVSGDIDLLVSANYSDKVKEILLKNGFLQGRLIGNKIIPYTREELIYQRSLSHQLAPFIKYTGEKLYPFVSIDINVNIVWGEEDFLVDMDEFLTHTEAFNIYGIKTFRLKPIWEFISLCMHHYKDMNSIYLIAEHGLLLSEYCDIYFYLISGYLDASELASVAKQYNLDKYVYYCIFYANEVFSDSQLKIYLKKLESRAARELLNFYGLAKKERREWTVPFEERLFDDCFKEKFYLSLTAEERYKIQVNRRFM